MSQQNTWSDAFQKPNSDDYLCILAADQAEYLCALNDGQDDLFINLPEVHNDQRLQIIASESPSRTPKWSHEVSARISIVNSASPLARAYLEDQFYTFEQWPSYMVELFILNGIHSYTYAMRNKICLFFWGNGGTSEIMFTLSSFYAPKVSFRTREEQHQCNESHRKCEGLFKTYKDQLHNPNYSGRYYYYNINAGRMLYMDNRPRHYGTRQEEPHLDRHTRFF